MMVKAAPRFATILCRWLGKLAIPIGEADSAAAGAMTVAKEERFEEVSGWKRKGTTEDKK